MMINQPARTRFAPSPTGRLHIGGARTALYAYLLARQTGGQFLLRLEDTDRKRFVPEAEQQFMEGLHWLGLQWDEGPDIGGPYGPYRQSERKEIYQAVAGELIERGHAYYCFCSAERLEQVRQQQQQQKISTRYDGTCRSIPPAEAAARVAAGEKYVVRFKMPQEGAITAMDRLRGEITVRNDALDDSILIKSDGLALYHLAAMTDDYYMKISHVIRGSEWLPSFPLHAHIIRAMGWPVPEFAHLSVFLKPTGKGKMSKRESAELMKDGYSIFVNDLAQLGYLPEATLNWISLMGWSYDDHTEVFTLSELIEKFSLDHLNPAPAAINFTKFDHFNGLHIRNLAVDDLASRLLPFFEAAGLPADIARLQRIVPLIRERIAGLDDAPQIAGFFFRAEVQPEAAELVAKKLTAAESAAAARRALAILESLPDLAPQTVEEPLRALVEELALSPGQLFGILRVAVTGQVVSPPLFESMEIIGRELVIQRIQRAIQQLEAL